jgi:hypothetical protein
MFQGQGLTVVKPGAPLLGVVPHASVFRPSHREGFVQVVSHPSHGRAHPSAEGHGFASSLHARGDVRRCRVLVPSSAHRDVVSVNRPSSRSYLV